MARTPTLLDAKGRPVRRQVLTRPLAEPGITGVRPVWPGTIASGLTPYRLSQIVRACDEGQLRDYAILAEEMDERDPHYASVLGTRKRVVSGVEPVVEPASESAADMAIAEAVRERIAGHDGFAAHAAIHAAVDAAVEAGKIAPASREFHVAAAKASGVEAFAAMVADLPVIAGGKTPAPKPSGTATQNHAATDEQRVVAQQLGLDVAVFSQEA